MADTFPCPNCSKPVPDDAESCPHCKFYFGPSDAAPPPPPPEPDDIVEDVEPEGDDAWGGRMDTVAEKTYDLEREREKTRAEGGPDWSAVDRFMGVDTSKEVKIIRDAAPAGLVRRFLAWTFDLVMIELPVVAGVLLALYVFHVPQDTVILYGVPAAVVCYVVLYVALNAGLHHKNGQTPGKRFFGVEVVKLDGTFIDASQAMRRAIAGLFAPLFVITAIFDLQQRAIHDYIAKTRVVRS